MPELANSPLATDTVTFLFTDIEGSTRLWEEAPDKMRPALARHDAVSRTAVESHRGVVVKMTGDGMHAAFDDALNALAAAVDLQQALADPAATGGIPLRVRCGLHAGIVEQRDNDFFGPPLNRAARIMNAAHGGQVLLSQAVVDGVQEILPAMVSLRDLGRVRLKDLSTPEHVYQVIHPDLRQEFPALRSLEATPNNLPQQATSFIGREKELADLKRLLARTRLLTLTGSGGCGKTRLALQVAANLLDRYPDGVWLVELASLAEAALVPQTVAAVLGVREETGKTLTQTLTEHLRSRQLMLILDNAEHLLAAGAQLADAVLRTCPQVVLLVSSREALGIDGEATFRVPSLSLPDPKLDTTPEQLSRYESVRLFIERAQFHMPQFALDHRNAGALASICARLDGIPLAIELAAARMRSMSVDEVNRRLDQRFRLLTGGSRTALPRQQTLRSLIDWSYDLLRENERALLCRLAVFSGGWTLAAAENVCIGGAIDEGAELDLLTSLIDKNLVMIEERDDATRYRLLETVRQYARDRLLESGEADRWRSRHLEYFVALGEEAEPHLTDSMQKKWLDRLAVEHDNVRSALTWSFAEGGNAVYGLRLGTAFWWFWSMRGYLTEGRHWLTELLSAAPDGPARTRAMALHGIGGLAWQQGDYPSARAHYERSLSIRREQDDRKGIASSLGNLGLVAYFQGDFATARTLYEESLAIRSDLGDRGGIAAMMNNLAGLAYEQGDFSSARKLFTETLELERELGHLREIGLLLNNLGEVARKQGDHAAAQTLCEESLANFRELGDRWGIASASNSLGTIAHDQGDNTAAKSLWTESLATFRELGDRRSVAMLLEGFAELATAAQRPVLAARILGGSQRLREEIGAPIPPLERAPYERQVVAARAALADDSAFDRTWSEGRALTLDQVIECALKAHG